MEHAIRDEVRLDPVLEALGRGDPEAWRGFLPTLRRITAELAPSFRDVSAADDVLGDLALLAHERWIPEWIARARRGEARSSLSLFLRDRMRDRLREEHRRRARRSALLAEAGDEIAAPAPPYPAPDQALAARELRARATGGDGALETVIAYREEGLDQREIAARVRTSRATIARRLALIGALIAPVIAGAVVLAWWVDRQEPRAEIAPADDRIAPDAPRTPDVPSPAIGAGGDLGPPMIPIAPAPVAPDPIAPERPQVNEQVNEDEVLDPWGPRTDVPAPAPRTPRAPRAPRGGEVVDPWSRSASPTATGAHAQGRLVVNTTPWSRVIVDGRAVGNTPIVGLSLPAGTHTLVLETGDGRTSRHRVVIRAGETARVVHHF